MKKNNEKRAGAERLFDAVTEIDHDLVDGSRPGKTGKTAAKTKKRLIAALVAAAVALGAVAGIALRETRSQGAEKPDPAETGSLTPPEERDRFNPFVVSAEYPVYETYDENRDFAVLRAGAVDDSTRNALVALAKICLTNVEDDSAVVSPASVYVALGILSDCSAGETRDQLTSLLGSDDADEIHAQVAALWDSFYLEGDESKSVVVSSLWLNNVMEYDTDFINSLSENYRASVFSGEFGSEEYDGQLKKWLIEQTKGLLADQTEEEHFDETTDFAVLTTLYRKEAWKMRFADYTWEAPFHGLHWEENCIFMGQEDEYSFVSGADFESVGVPLEDGSAVWFVLPNKGKTTDDVIRSSELWNCIESWGKSPDARITTRGRVNVPKFDVKSKTDLIPALRELGVTAIFQEDKADFTPLLGNGNHKDYVQLFENYSRIKIDESGIEATSGTLFDGGTLGVMPEVYLDRPFVFVMTNPAGLPLFAGVVNQIG